MKESHLFLRIDVKSFPTQDVRAIGLKLAGSLLQLETEVLGINRMSACLHARGTVPDSQHALKRLERAGKREGHLLMIL